MHVLTVHTEPYMHITVCAELFCIMRYGNLCDNGIVLIDCFDFNGDALDTFVHTHERTRTRTRASYCFACVYVEW